MKYQKTALIFFLLTIIFAQTACESVNSAERQNEQETNKSIEAQKTNGKPKKLPTFDAENFAPPKKEKVSTRLESNEQKQDNFVCPEPNLPCQHAQKQFDEWELSFRMPKKLVPNKIYKSAPFYAVILRKIEEGCDDLDFNPTVETERLRIQKKIPSRKVFAEYSCPNMSAVNYLFEGKMDKSGERILYMDYIAVYAGVDEKEGREIFDLLRKDYPRAELKKMTAAYSQIEQ